jgi:hypothetical protein
MANFSAEAFALDHVDVQDAVHKKVVDLGDTPVPFNSQIVNDRPILRVLQMEVDVISRLLLALKSSASQGQIPFEPSPLLGAKNLLQPSLQTLDVLIARLAVFENHTSIGIDKLYPS